MFIFCERGKAAIAELIFSFTVSDMLFSSIFIYHENVSILRVYIQVRIAPFPTPILMFLNAHSVAMAISDTGTHRLNWKGIKHQINAESTQHLPFKQVLLPSHHVRK